MANPNPNTDNLLYTRYYVSRSDCSSFYLWARTDGAVRSDSHGRTLDDYRDDGFSVTLAPTHI